MELVNSVVVKANKKLYSHALILAMFTVCISLAEAFFSTYYGYENESLSLFGFGIGSFIEIVSAIGVLSMIFRLKSHGEGKRSDFEKTALRITGSCFYILVIGLAVTAVYDIYTGHKPDSTLPGVVIALISIALMLLLYFGKLHVGKRLDSEAILGDAGCTKVCIYMSLVLLVVSGLYQLIQFPYFDAMGSMGLAYFSFKEGKECFENAKTDKHCTCG